MGRDKLSVVKMLRMAYLLLIVDSASAMLSAFPICYFLPEPIDAVVSLSVSVLILARSISYVLKIARACSVSRMYVDDGDDDE